MHACGARCRVERGVQTVPKTMSKLPHIPPTTTTTPTTVHHTTSHHTTVHQNDVIRCRYREQRLEPHSVLILDRGLVLGRDQWLTREEGVLSRGEVVIVRAFDERGVGDRVVGIPRCRLRRLVRRVRSQVREEGRVVRPRLDHGFDPAQMCRRASIARTLIKKNPKPPSNPPKMTHHGSLLLLKSGAVWGKRRVVSSDGQARPSSLQLSRLSLLHNIN